MSIYFKWSDLKKRFAMFRNGKFEQLTDGNMRDKISFVQRVQGIADNFAHAADTAENILGVYHARGFNAGGENEIKQVDLDPFYMSIADFTSMIELIQQFQKFIDNRPVTQRDYDTILNKMRTDV